MNRKLSMAAAIIAMLPAAPAAAQEYKIGISAGLTGYAATVDRAWRDGVEIAAATLNGKGGVMGRKLAVVAEDNRSEPQEAVTVYRKMISSDNVNVFISGCVSAGNFAGAPIVDGIHGGCTQLVDQPVDEGQDRPLGPSHHDRSGTSVVEPLHRADQ